MDAAIRITAANCGKWSRSAVSSTAIDAWITGIRREQAPTRANAKLIEWDNTFQLVKVNPLVAVDLGGRMDVHQASMKCRTTRCTTETTRASAAPTARSPSCRAKIRASGRWKDLTKTECGIHKAS